MKNLKIAHITSVHSRNDVRIFYKECTSLSKINNYDVALIVADGLGDEKIEKIEIYDVGKSKSRLRRMLITSIKVYQKAKKLDYDVYHLHDPELLPIASKLKKIGKIVIFDFHEDVPLQLLVKPYLNKYLLNIISRIYKYYESQVSKEFDAIVTATEHIEKNFLKINKNVQAINNYPILDELKNNVSWKNREESICYVGGISKIRGIYEMVDVFKNLPEYTFNIAGDCSENSIKEYITLNNVNNNISYKGFLNRKDIQELLKNTKVGLVILHPVKNYLDSLPIKMFEYMAAGIPVICSDFPLWKTIILKNNCGLVVDPLDRNAISTAITRILLDEEFAEMMSENAYKLIERKYNWQIEEKKLIDIYEQIHTSKFNNS